MEIYRNCPVYYAEDTRSWRKWLEKNGETTPSVFLIIYNISRGVPSIMYDEAVDAALCFG